MATRARLPPVYSDPLTDDDRKILALSLAQIVDECNARTLCPRDILHAYGKRALLAQDATNCLSDIMFHEAERVPPLHRPLTGVVVSLKDCIDVAGHDTTLGYSRNVGRPVEESAPIVRLLRDAGALIHTKTTVPTGLLSFETTSDLFGETTNPYNPAFSPGASTGGGAVLVAYQGSVVEIGTDIGGSTRFPAAYCGVYSVKSSVGRFPSDGCVPCLPGQESAPTVTSPIARTLDDLQEFWQRVVEMRPWMYDHTCVPLPWRTVDFVLSGRKPKWGVIWSDGIVPPSPACTRALAETVAALRRAGHEVVDFKPPSILEGLKIGYQLMFADGGASLRSLRRWGESTNGAQAAALLLLSLPLWIKVLFAFMLRTCSRPWGRNDTWAALVEVFNACSVEREHALNVERERYKRAWGEAMADLDFLLTVPHAIPAVPKGGSDAATLVSASYAFLFNVLDYAAGVQPVMTVDATRDALPAEYGYAEMNDIARGVYGLYDAAAMHGLPVAVQVVGRRLEEEKVLAGMREVERALWDAGKGFVQKKF
ncbi:amidase signature enzyme [Laetiporus sulphureus 93-53]|uniref:Amidase signature enzyme n=1 Tax=Laetiporus sulphureus 93-53 TaxID=1314785 RepID=A0A165GGW5_9APHY|nr:amidase signature enzyme [Laetiporus sulphureus 93-53]KZT10329.1 amidase signature enzyme [Laetiporus sulphureus 93-53]